MRIHKWPMDSLTKSQCIAESVFTSWRLQDTVCERGLVFYVTYTSNNIWICIMIRLVYARNTNENILIVGMTACVSMSISSFIYHVPAVKSLRCETHKANMWHGFIIKRKILFFLVVKVRYVIHHYFSRRWYCLCSKQMGYIGHTKFEIISKLWRIKLIA